MDFAFKKTQRKRKIVSEEPATATAAPPVVEQPPTAQRPKLDPLPQSRRKSRVGAAAAPPPATPAAEPQPAPKPAARSATRATRADSPAPALAANPPAADPRAELVLEGALAQAREALGADADVARQSAAVVGRFLELVRAAAPDLSHLVAATDTLPKLPLVDALERESRAWSVALDGAHAAACEATELAPEPTLAPPAPAADLAPELVGLCVRAGFALDAADANVRWARAAQADARAAQLRAAERARAKAFGAYEHVDNPQALLRALSTA